MINDTAELLPQLTVHAFLSWTIIIILLIINSYHFLSCVLWRIICYSGSLFFYFQRMNIGLRAFFVIADSLQRKV